MQTWSFIWAGGQYCQCGPEEEAWASATCPCLVGRGTANEVQGWDSCLYLREELHCWLRGRRVEAKKKEKKALIPPQAWSREGLCSRSHSKLVCNQAELEPGLKSHISPLQLQCQVTDLKNLRCLNSPLGSSYPSFYIASRRTMVKNMPANVGNAGSIPRSGRSLGGGNGNPLQYACLENSMDRGT